MPPLAKIPPLPLNRPWRLGTTSYVYPDDILPNVESLAGHVEDIELILFESEAANNLPSPEIIARLDALRRAHGFTFTIHFPIDRQLGHPDPRHRRDMIHRMLRIMDVMNPLEPYAYIVHPGGIVPNATPDRVATWQQDMTASIHEILAHGCSPHLLAIENLDFPFDWCTPWIEATRLSVCIDLGHLWRGKQDITKHFRRWLPRARVIHLHGEKQGRDHISLAAMERVRLLEALHEMATPPAFHGVVTLEVFSFEDTTSSVNTLREVLS